MLLNLGPQSENITCRCACGAPEQNRCRESYSRRDAAVAKILSTITNASAVETAEPGGVGMKYLRYEEA